MAPDHGKVDRSKGPAMGLPLQGRLAFLDRWKGSAGAAWDPHHAPPSLEPKWLQKQLPYIWSWWLWWLLLLPPYAGLLAEYPPPRTRGLEASFGLQLLPAVLVFLPAAAGGAAAAAAARLRLRLRIPKGCGCGCGWCLR